MGEASQSGEKKAAADFQEDSRAPLIELNSTDSTELWLIQWPKDQVPNFDGQQIPLDLLRDKGKLGSFEVSSGKSYDVVSHAADEPATVFLSSAGDSKIVGKITRRVSFVHYLEPSEVPKDDTKKLKQLHERSAATSLTNSVYTYSTPAKSRRPGPSSGRASTHSSGHKSSISEEKPRSKHSKRRSSQVDSGGHSEEKKEKKRKKDVA
uniref:mediator-associated protein 2 n=1 Tax=Erigeron canadensis TaxID=72917 RepID=UPI001CB961DD|nr:mediator-associated protein 2 [Erigeron canadensis]